MLERYLYIKCCRDWQASWTLFKDQQCSNRRGNKHYESFSISDKCQALLNWLKKLIFFYKYIFLLPIPSNITGFSMVRNLIFLMDTRISVYQSGFTNKHLISLFLYCLNYETLMLLELYNIERWHCSAHLKGYSLNYLVESCLVQWAMKWCWIYFTWYVFQKVLSVRWSHN